MDILINIRSMIAIIGYLIATFGVLMFIPATIDFIGDEYGAKSFFMIGLICSFIGFSFAFANKSHINKNISIKQGIFLTSIAWIVLCFVASLPYVFSDLNFSFTDGFFEVMSGFSTTGASIIPDVSVLSTGFHFWRLLMGWFGGVGIVLISVIFIPTLQSMGMILFKIVGMETFGHSLSKARQTVIGIVILYFVATIVFTIILNIVGEISFFDSLIHIMSSISTTGFSNKNESVMYFASYKVEWIICFVMFLAGSPYILMYYAVFLRKFNLLIKDQQFLGYFYFIVIISVILSAYLFLYNGFSILDSLTKATFSTLSMLTGTGMANIDYTKINPFMTMVLFFTMMVGGCAGSAAGGLKIYRLQVFFKIAKISIKKIFLTNRVIVPYYNGRPVSSDSAMAILSYIILFFVTLVVFSCVLSVVGLDFITAISSAVACLSGVGPGIGGIVGPVGNYSLLPDSAKWVLSIAMFMGRIELFGVFILFYREFWNE